jgi:hypothetical protein
MLRRDMVRAETITGGREHTFGQRIGTPAQVLNPRKSRNKEERDRASNALSHDCGEEQVGVESFFCPEVDSTAWCR